jgi:hypothetical protein
VPFSFFGSSVREDCPHRCFARVTAEIISENIKFALAYILVYGIIHVLFYRRIVPSRGENE